METSSSVPTLPDGLADGWRELETTEDRVFDIGIVSVTAATSVYDDQSLRSAVREATGVDGLWSFRFLSHVTIKPAPKSTTGPIRRLVTDRAKRGFTDQLEDRGFDGVREVSTSERPVDGRSVTVAEYEGRCTESGVTLGVRAWLLVAPVDGQYVLVGGVTPTGVRDADDDALAEAIRSRIDPAGFRTDLFAVLRGVVDEQGRTG